MSLEREWWEHNKERHDHFAGIRQCCKEANSSLLLEYNITIKLVSYCIMERRIHAQWVTMGLNNMSPVWRSFFPACVSLNLYGGTITVTASRNYLNSQDFGYKKSVMSVVPKFLKRKVVFLSMYVPHLHQNKYFYYLRNLITHRHQS